jgi:hypothetical protein
MEQPGTDSPFLLCIHFKPGAHWPSLSQSPPHAGMSVSLLPQEFFNGAEVEGLGLGL